MSRDGVYHLFFCFWREVSVLSEKIAGRTDDITDEEWLTINKFNRDMVQDYLDNQSDLSAKTRPAYKSGLRIFFKYVKDFLEDKNFTQIKKKRVPEIFKLAY